MKIIGVEGYSPEAIRDEVNRGARMVMFTYCVSLLVVTLKRPSSIYFVRGGQSRIMKGLPFSLVSLVMGWWGIPWGPIYTIGSLITNFGGGLDVTDEVMRSILPNAPAPGESSQFTQIQTPPTKNKSALTLRQKMIGGGVVALIFLSLYAAWCSNAAKRSVYLLSGLPHSYTVSLNGEKITLRPCGVQRVEQPEGEFKLTETPDGSTETFRFETPFWSRPFDNQIVVINPDKLALYYQRNVVYYSEKAGHMPQDEAVNYTLFANRRVNVMPKAQYVFEEPPRNIQMSSNQTTSTRTALGHITGISPQEASDLIEKKLGHAQAETYLQDLVSLQADDEKVLTAVIVGLKPEKALALFESKLGDRPLQINLHRCYQNLSEKFRPGFDLAAQYAALAGKEPENGVFQYLLGRIQHDPTQARAFYQKALTAPQPCAFAHIGLSSLELASANFEAALEHCVEAEKKAINSETTHEAKKACLLALHQYDELIADIRRLRQKTPDNIELAAEEIRYSLLKTPEAQSVKSLIDSFCQTALADWKESEKTKAKAYLEGTVAYTLGDEKMFANKISIFPSPLLRFQAAVCERNLKTASEAITSDARSDFQLMLYLLASLVGDSEAATKSWTVAEASLRKDYVDEPEMIAFLDGKSTASPEKICRLQIMPDQKRVLLAALGVRYPQHRPLFHDYAVKFNNNPDFPHILVKAVVKQPSGSL